MHLSSTPNLKHVPQGNSDQALPPAPEGTCIPLLPSGPGGVHRPSSRWTQPSTPPWENRGAGFGPQRGIQPRCSGLRVQGTASSPSSTASTLMVWHPADPVNRKGWPPITISEGCGVAVAIGWLSGMTLGNTKRDGEEGRKVTLGRGRPQFWPNSQNLSKCAD